MIGDMLGNLECSRMTGDVLQISILAMWLSMGIPGAGLPYI
jgi:hypothetical protein